MHWGYDLGIAELVRGMCVELGCPAVLSRFSRLLVDPNRPVGAETMFRRVADGQPIRLNENLSEAEAQLRIDGYYRPYHDAVDAMAAAHPGSAILGMHSFTDVYEGQPREVEIGILYDRDRDFAEAWFEALSGHGYEVRYNEPWSGLEGLMYSPQLHATRHLRQVVELEIRQDLLADPVKMAHLTQVLSDAVRATTQG